ncbi:hypothetical protein KC347_g37 [Hortaea werneckii]|nr:hypothetical protein KC347_g37 [Hortaea werneckii]
MRAAFSILRVPKAKPFQWPCNTKWLVPIGDPQTPLEEWSVSLQLLPTKTNWSKILPTRRALDSDDGDNEFFYASEGPITCIMYSRETCVLPPFIDVRLWAEVSLLPTRCLQGKDTLRVATLLHRFALALTACLTPQTAKALCQLFSSHGRAPRPSLLQAVQLAPQTPMHAPRGAHTMAKTEQIPLDGEKRARLRHTSTSERKDVLAAHPFRCQTETNYAIAKTLQDGDLQIRIAGTMRSGLGQALSDSLTVMPYRSKAKTPQDGTCKAR